jgi:thiamine-monophosphate kinase
MLGVVKMRIGELELIEQIRAGAGARRGAGLALGIGDDCAILRPPKGHEVLVTTDFSLEGRHFRRDWHPADSIGHRALARGLSDLAAMGARPMAAFLSLALPDEILTSRTGRRWVDGFFAGLGKLAGEFEVPLAGGDTAEAPGGLVLADIVLVGSAPVGRSLRRSGGRAGDLLYVTGSLGGSAEELARIAGGGELKRGGEHPHLYPAPRVRSGMELVKRKLATAAIDLSDGLSTDLAHLCAESRVGAEVSESAMPVSAGASLDQALNGGEDYELLFTAPPRIKVPPKIAGVAVTQIGRLVRGSGVSIFGAEGGRRALEPRGWEHFRGE